MTRRRTPNDGRAIHVGRGIGAAALAAGPIFMLALAISESGGSGTGEPYAIGALLVLSIPFGAILSVVPIIVGTAAMLLLARRAFVARVAPVWMIAGGGIAGLPFIWIDHDRSDGSQSALILGLCGALCALVVRAFVRWPDPA